MPVPDAGGIEQSVGPDSSAVSDSRGSEGTADIHDGDSGTVRLRNAVCSAPSLLPGCLILLTGFFSRERIGYGDGWLMLALGMWMNTAELLRLFSGGVMLGFLYSLGCRKRDIPLVPFLTAAYVMEKWI